MFITYLRQIEGSVQRVVDGMIQLQDGMAALDRLCDMLSVERNPAESVNAKRPELRVPFALIKCILLTNRNGR